MSTQAQQAAEALNSTTSASDVLASLYENASVTVSGSALVMHFDDGSTVVYVPAQVIVA
jgi:hypothetical protein